VLECSDQAGGVTTFLGYMAQRGTQPLECCFGLISHGFWIGWARSPGPPALTELVNDLASRQQPEVNLMTLGLAAALGARLGGLSPSVASDAGGCTERHADFEHVFERE
jgi:hypothetical protein